MVADSVRTGSCLGSVVKSGHTVFSTLLEIDISFTLENITFITRFRHLLCFSIACNHLE